MKITALQKSLFRLSNVNTQYAHKPTPSSLRLLSLKSCASVLTSMLLPVVLLVSLPTYATAGVTYHISGSKVTNANPNFKQFKDRIEALPRTKNLVEVEGRSVAKAMYKNYGKAVDMFINEYSQSVQAKYGARLTKPTEDSFRYAVIAFGEWMQGRYDSKYFNAELIADSTLQTIENDYAMGDKENRSKILKQETDRAIEETLAEGERLDEEIAQSRAEIAQSRAEIAQSRAEIAQGRAEIAQGRAESKRLDESIQESMKKIQENEEFLKKMGWK